MDTNALLYLVKDELKRRKSKKDHAKWRLFYLAAGIVLLLTVTAFFANKVKPMGFMFITFGLPYMSFMLAYSLVKKEWKNGTLGWWLSLPYSRSTLILSKYAASLCVVFLIFTAAWLITLFFYVYATIWQGSFEVAGLLSFMSGSSVWYLFVLAVIPFMNAFGLFTSIAGQSRLKPLTPLLWMIYGLSGNAIFWLPQTTNRGEFWNTHIENGSIPFGPYEFAITVPVSIGLGAILLYCSAIMLKKQVVL
ncbi:ABC transporter permease [Paenibacillus apiarius]|uniref:ABC transporter permease n=1 Tax=Paenibacillus apiarius TaxID=46240 RepID=A0ABT4DSQ8_9BACL|nr:ABC transporter permease subunit [Paenibacillus apiarius]MCY9515800.1 ABC transporter permease [Paenibacillus apiarius]MCY9520386.1 ABC transporter permease [Paenibacillus apiarius]MCY9555006.1 ABC transporter permease [Paenibacillus apiarius]MCY9559040.1 ABC transporter permease [Paenibacillus apiarius]MCY9685621.1 ABC transporter permease [Paenibacillus apiarius]